MALRDHPYIPLYVKDVLTDEKLVMCSAEAHGIYLRLICILHKQKDYGQLELQKRKIKSKNKYENFASLLSRHMPFSKEQIQLCLTELSNEDVIQVTNKTLSQKRMVYDGEISLTRAVSGKKGGSNVTKQYGKNGYLYWMSNLGSKNKIGISVNPKNRLYRLRCDLKLKNFEIEEQIKVENMGKSEDIAFDFFKNELDGEWVLLTYKEMKEKFSLLKAKLQAKTQANSEDEIENEFVTEDVNTTKKNKKIYVDINLLIAQGITGKGEIIEKLKGTYSEHQIVESYAHIEWHKNKKKKVFK